MRYRAKSKKRKVLPRVCEGEKESQPLLNFLNPNPDLRLGRTANGVVRRGPVVHHPDSNIAELVRGFKNLDLLRCELDGSLPHEKQAVRRDAKKIADILTGRMARYAGRDCVAVKEIIFSGRRGSGEPVSVIAPWQDDDFYKWLQCSDRIPFDLQETTAFHTLKEVVKRRLLWRLRLCAECKKVWLWGKRKTSKCCSGKCKKAYSRRKKKENDAYARKRGK